jgi:hypothetical protein
MDHQIQKLPGLSLKLKRFDRCGCCHGGFLLEKFAIIAGPERPVPKT